MSDPFLPAFGFAPPSSGSVGPGSGRFWDNFSRPTGSLRHPQKRTSETFCPNYQKTIYTENVTAPSKILSFEK
jgi:hypothetical protein